MLAAAALTLSIARGKAVGPAASAARRVEGGAAGARFLDDAMPSVFYIYVHMTHAPRRAYAPLPSGVAYLYEFSLAL